MARPSTDGRRYGNTFTPQPRPDDPNTATARDWWFHPAATTARSRTSVWYSSIAGGNSVRITAMVCCTSSANAIDDDTGRLGSDEGVLVPTAISDAVMASLSTM